MRASRNSQSAYIDVDTHPVEALDIDVAGRFENYSDFGTTVNGKIAARYDFNDMFALRGAVSSGFRAPSLQQEYVAYTSTIFVAANQINSTILRASNPVAATIGAVPLKPENSVNYSVGGVFRLDEQEKLAAEWLPLAEVPRLAFKGERSGLAVLREGASGA